MRHLGSIAVVVALGTACSSADKKRTPVPAEAGVDAGSGGAPGAGGSGGNTASSGGAPPASGGTPNTGGTKDASVEASVEAGPDADAAKGPLVCPAVPDPNAPDGSYDAATRPMLDRWRDWNADTCQVCPTARSVECWDLAPGYNVAGSPLATFDMATRKLSLQLAAGVAEIVSGTVTIAYSATLPDGGVIYDSAAAPLVVVGNALTADLSTVIPVPDTIRVTGFDVDDACGAHTSIGANFSWYDVSVQPEAGTVVNVYCEPQPVP